MSPRASVLHFTPEECRRAHEIRAWAERPENAWSGRNPRFDPATNEGVFAGVQTTYSIRLDGGRRWRQISFCLAKLELPPPEVCAAIMDGLFGFVKDRGVTTLRDARDPFLTGATQVIGDERACRVCGCTVQRACIGGCAWVGDEDLCTACRS